MILHRKKIIIYVGGTILLLSMVAFTLYYLLQGITEDYQTLLMTKKEEASITKDIENIAEFENISLTYESEFVSFQDIFINPDIPIPFIEFLESASQSSLLELSIVAADPKEIKGDPWQSMDFQLTLEGYYPNFVEFVEKLEAAPYLIELRNLSIRKFKGRLDKPAGHGELTLLVRAFVK
ncbi:MAG TPA: hypothetical protein ENI04_01265 [Candidatus Wildermuthbacteria bacterium]|nr:hypothetical protein [Candidatus Wildermuthbacteria bacterium]